MTDLPQIPERAGDALMREARELRELANSDAPADEVKRRLADIYSRIPSDLLTEAGIV